VIAENANSTLEPVFADVSTVNILCSAPNCLASSSVTSLLLAPLFTYAEQTNTEMVVILKCPKL